MRWATTEQLIDKLLFAGVSDDGVFPRHFSLRPCLTSEICRALVYFQFLPHVSVVHDTPHSLVELPKEASRSRRFPS